MKISRVSLFHPDGGSVETLRAQVLFKLLSNDRSLNLPRQLSNRLISRLVLAIVATTVAILALWPNLRLPTFMLLGQEADFFYHIVGFFVLTSIATVSLGRGLFAVGLAAYLAVWLELLQVLVPGREVMIIDLTASLLGVGLGGFLVLLVRQAWYWCVRTEWLQSRS